MTRDGEAASSGPGRCSARTGSGWAGWIALALAVLVAVVAPRDARAAAFEVADTGWEGGSELLEIAKNELGAARVKPVAVLDWSEVTPEDGVLAIHPLQAMDPDDVAAFMKAGGRLAVLDDYGEGEQTLSRFRIYRIPAPSRPRYALRNKPALAIAEPVGDTVAGHSMGQHPVVAHVQQLVTNHATALDHPNLTPVLRIQANGEPDGIIAVAGSVGKGRLFAMSDPSAVMNQMLRYPGNRAFVAGLARYLVDDEGGTRRQGRLFIVANRFSEEGSFGGQGGVRKDLESFRKALKEAFDDARRDGLPTWAHLLLAAGVALGLAAWVARASARPYLSPIPRYARPTPLVSQGGVAGRFALLAAPSSPRSLALLELKSALYEGLKARLGYIAEPAPEALGRMIMKAAPLHEGEYAALKEVLAAMAAVESAVVAGRPAKVSQAELSRAASVVHDVLARLPIPAAGPLMPFVSASASTSTSTSTSKKVAKNPSPAERAPEATGPEAAPNAGDSTG